MNEEKMVRVNITMAPALLEKIEERSKRTGDTRSNLIRRAIIQYLEAQDMIEQMQGLVPHIPELLEINRKALAENQTVKTSKQLSLADVIDGSAKKTPKRAK